MFKLNIVNCSEKIIAKKIAKKIRRRSILATIIILIIAATPILSLHHQVFGASSTDNMTYVKFKEVKSAITNPCRGWYTDDLTDIKKIKANNITLVMVQLNLKKYKNKKLDKAILNKASRQFKTARKNNCSVIFRAAYDFTGKKKPEPHNFKLILRHISQLRPIFMKNADILYVVQAGFLGPWGEWHSSYFSKRSDGMPSEKYQKAIFNALIKASPVSSYIEVRRPSFVRTIMNNKTINASNAFSGNRLSRIAVHNDAIFNGSDDAGTYTGKKWNRKKELKWQNNHNMYTPFIAESNALKKQSKTKNAIKELRLLHASSLNLDYYPAVIRRWKKEKYSGLSTFKFIAANLGYRFVLQRVGISTNVEKGGELKVAIEVENKGFGNMLQEKNVEIVMRRGDEVVRRKISDDIRMWSSKKGVMKKNNAFNLPTDIKTGKWTVYLSISDKHSKLKNNPAYSVKFSNKNIWQSHMNRIGVFNVVDHS